MKNADYNSTASYSEVLDPYVGASNQMTPTKDSNGKIVDDHLTFTALSTGNQPACAWTEVVGGILQQKAGATIGEHR